MSAKGRSSPHGRRLAATRTTLRAPRRDVPGEARQDWLADAPALAARLVRRKARDDQDAAFLLGALGLEGHLASPSPG
jgi:hypothetical protein